LWIRGESMNERKEAASGARTATAIEKAPTYIQGVDEILDGGIPRGRTTLVGGAPGTGKTVFALEQLSRAARTGEPGIFVTFEEGADAIRRNGRSMGWDLEA